MRVQGLLSAIAAIALAVGCNDPKSGRGFTLPDGDAELGQALFVELQCGACHLVTELALPRPQDPELTIVLGGEVRRIKSYGQLVTSVINPSHRLAKGYAEHEVAVEGVSKMRNYNDTLTVSQLIDLVAFLQSRYELVEYSLSDYPMYP